MALQIEDGISWDVMIPRIERLPPGRSLDLSFHGGRTFRVQRQRDGLVRAMIDRDGHWIGPTSMDTLVGILRQGLERQARS